MAILEILVVLVIFIAFVFILVYNGLITKKNRVQNAWSQIDVELKRRYDLIPNLVATVKGYMKYEKGVLTDITKLRSNIMSGSVQDKALANNQLSKALKTIFANVENYPELKASENVKNLQEQISDTEDRIAFIRISYNDYVLDYNNNIQEFPGNILAPMLSFAKIDYFQTAEDQKADVKVNINEDTSSTSTDNNASTKSKTDNIDKPSGTTKTQKK